jgi:uncharacterized protein (TIGR00369 family)
MGNGRATTSTARVKPAKPAAGPPITRVPQLAGLAANLRIRLTEITRIRIVGEMRIGPRHMNGVGRVHGGAIMAFGDAVGASGAVVNLADGAQTATIESKTNFFAAGQGPVLVGEAVPLHIGRTTMVWQTTIRNADGRMVAMVTQTQIVIPPPATGSEPPSPWRRQAARQ